PPADRSKTPLSIAWSNDGTRLAIGGQGQVYFQGAPTGVSPWLAEIGTDCSVTDITLPDIEPASPIVHVDWRGSGIRAATRIGNLLLATQTNDAWSVQVESGGALAGPVHGFFESYNAAYVVTGEDRSAAVRFQMDASKVDRGWFKNDADRSGYDFEPSLGLRTVSAASKQSGASRQVALGYADGSVGFFRLSNADARFLSATPLFSSAVSSVAIHPDHGWTAVGSRTGEIVVIGADKDMLAGPIAAHTGAVEALVWSNDAQLLSAGASAVTVFDLSDLAPIGRNRREWFRAKAAHIHEDGVDWLIEDQGELVLESADGSRSTLRAAGDLEEISVFEASPDQSRILISALGPGGTQDATLSLYGLTPNATTEMRSKDGDQVRYEPAPANLIKSKPSPDGGLVYSTYGLSGVNASVLDMLKTVSEAPSSVPDGVIMTQDQYDETRTRAHDALKTMKGGVAVHDWTGRLIQTLAHDGFY
ncbi:MAG: WD40 repeat domain-containing protein, partial [Pseudomonadota bacterium]